MKITIPARYACYIDLLVEAGLYRDTRRAYAGIIRLGLDEAESDVAMGGGGLDMDLSLLRGRPLELSVPVARTEQARIRVVARAVKMVPAKAFTAVFLYGLFEHYLMLRDALAYKRDPAGDVLFSV